MRYTFLFVLVGSVLASGSLQAADYFPPADNSVGWRTATSAAQVRESAVMD